MSGRKLAVFDIDGTIATNGMLDPEALKGIHHLQSLGYITTVCTGRGYHPMMAAIGHAYNQIISDDALLVLEHGTRITNKQGKTVFAEYLGVDEIEHVVDFIRANLGIVTLSWYNPEDIRQRMQLWCKDMDETNKEVVRRQAYADPFSASLGEYRERLLKAKITNIECALPFHLQIQNLKIAFTHTPMNLVFQDGHMGFLKNNINKGIAILYLLKAFNVAYEDLLVAGNAINDIEMLDLSAGHRILVGPEAERELVLPYLSGHESITYIESPAALGYFLQNVS